MVNSKQKGSAGERELARVLRDTLGIAARRGQQYSGSPDSPDIVTDVPDLHIECKRVEHLNIWAALAQSIRDAGTKIATVAFRKNRGEWYIALRLADIVRFAKAIIGSAGKVSPVLSTTQEDSSLERGSR